MSVYLHEIFQKKEGVHTQTHIGAHWNLKMSYRIALMSEWVHCYSICLIFHHFEIFKWPYILAYVYGALYGLSCELARVSCTQCVGPILKYVSAINTLPCLLIYFVTHEWNEKNWSDLNCWVAEKNWKIVWLYDEVCVVVGGHVYASVDLFSLSHLFATFASQLAYARAFASLFFVRSFIHFAAYLARSYTLQSSLYNTFNDANALTYRLKILCFRSNERIQSMHNRNAVVVLDFVFRFKFMHIIFLWCNREWKCSKTMLPHKRTADMHTHTSTREKSQITIFSYCLYFNVWHLKMFVCLEFYWFMV